MEKSPGASILIVDDEEMIRSLLSRALRGDGHSVTVVRDKAETIEVMAGLKFDLIVVDKNLPDGSGLDLITEARELGHQGEVIVITGYSDIDSAIQAVALGVFRYVRKPFNLEALRVDINTALETGRLRRDLDHRTRELEDANTQLKEALQQAHESEERRMQSERLATIGYLAAGVAHEINNPLTLLSMTIPYAVSELGSLVEAFGEAGIDEHQVASLAHLSRSLQPTQEAVELLMRLASDLHSVGRADKPEMQPVRVAETVATAVRLARHQLKRKARVEIQIPEDLTVKGHPSRLVQVFINLLTNAAKAIREGGPDDNLVQISAHLQDGNIDITVSDPGVGIPAANLRRVFEPFFTSSEGTNPGVGIGLALVKEIIDNHGGSISVDSEEDSGTAFTVTLPQYRSTSTSLAVIKPGMSEMVRTRRRILFVDTDKDNLAQFEESFGQMHQVLLAATPEALAEIVAAEGDAIDAVVCELLPDDHPVSAQLASSVADRPELGERQVFLADPGEPSDRARAAGQTVMSRPVRPANLLAAIYRLPARAD